MTKPREFWITDNKDNSGFSVETEFNHHRYFGSCNVFHTIEYSAYQTAVEELKNVRRQLDESDFAEITCRIDEALRDLGEIE